MSDLIDRQAAIDAVEESRRLNHHQDGKEACAHEYEHRHFLKILRDLPSAQPKKIRGQWSIKGQAIDTVRGYWAKCSTCGHSVFGGGNYCSNCGSYNKGEVNK